ncbi:MAG: hypothetical protein ACK5LK_10625 [Chthoniobacterales bacterium]
MKILPLITAISLTTLIGPSFAQTTWTGAVDNSWSTAGNWNNGIPSTGGITYFANGSLPDSPISVTVDSVTPFNDVNFRTSGNRSVTFNGGTMNLQKDGNINWNESSGGTSEVVVNSDIDVSSVTAGALSRLYIIMNNRNITINGDITTSGTGSRLIQLNGSTTLTINGSNALGLFSFGGTGEVIAGSTSALGSYVQKTTASTLSLRSDVVVDGSGTNYSWLQSSGAPYTYLRISETAASSADRTLTFTKRIAGSTGAIEFIDNINSTGSLILDLKYSGLLAQELPLITNDTAIIRFSQTGDQTYTGAISGTGQVEKITGTGTTTFTAINTYTGNTTVDAGTLALADNAGLTFNIGADGVNNMIGGTGAVTLDGDFTFDLSGADTTNGNQWLIVDVENLTEAFGSTFTVNGFTADGGGDFWTYIDGGNTWTFVESTGILSLGVIPEPNSLVLGVFGLAAFCLRRKMRN